MIWSSFNQKVGIDEDIIDWIHEHECNFNQVNLIGQPSEMMNINEEYSMSGFKQMEN